MEKKDFTKNLSDICQHGCVMMAIGLAHELGVFKLLCNIEQPVSAMEVALKLNLKERYTKELLSCMVSANIIHQDHETDLYFVPECERAALLQSIGFTPILAMFGKRHEQLKECIQKDGPYEAGVHVIDLGCGSGNLTCVLAQMFPCSSFVGLDYSAQGIEMARSLCTMKELTNVTFSLGDVHNLPAEWTNSFDIVYVYDVLHDLPDPFRALQEVYRVLKDDGCFSVTDPGVHSNPKDNANNMNAAMYYSCSLYLCLPSSMTEPPHIGFGACWGIEEIEKALVSSKFKINCKSLVTVIGPKAFFYCTK